MFSVVEASTKSPSFIRTQLSPNSRMEVSTAEMTIRVLSVDRTPTNDNHGHMGSPVDIRQLSGTVTTPRHLRSPESYRQSGPVRTPHSTLAANPGSAETSKKTDERNFICDYRSVERMKNPWPTLSPKGTSASRRPAPGEASTPCELPSPVSHAVRAKSASRAGFESHAKSEDFQALFFADLADFAWGITRRRPAQTRCLYPTYRRMLSPMRSSVRARSASSGLSSVMRKPFRSVWKPVRGVTHTPSEAIM